MVTKRTGWYDTFGWVYKDETGQAFRKEGKVFKRLVGWNRILKFRGTVGPHVGGVKLTKFHSDNDRRVYFDPHAPIQPGLFIVNKDGYFVREFHGVTTVRGMFNATVDRFINPPPITNSPANDVINLTTSPSPKAKSPSPSPKAKSPSPSPKAKSPSPPPKAKTPSPKAKTPLADGVVVTTTNGVKIYKVGNDLKIMGPTGVLTGKFKNKATWLAHFGMKVKAKAIPYANMTNTGKTISAHKVYVHKGNLAIVKNGVLTHKFAGKTGLKKLLAPKAKTPNVNSPTSPASVSPVVVVTSPGVPVVVDSLFPVVPPGPAKLPVVKKYQKIINALAKDVADRKRVAVTNAVNMQQTNAYKNFMQDQGKAFAFMSRVDTLRVQFSTVQGFNQHTPGHWRNNIEVPRWEKTKFELKFKYNDCLYPDQMRFSFGRNMKSFGDIQTRDIIDVDWLARQDAFLKTLTAREVFLMFGYSYNGDTWAHAHLDNKFDLSMFRAAIASLSFFSSEYFAFFFQARELYKINMGSMEADYREVMKRCREEKDVKVIRAMAQMFINELNDLILKAPKTTHDFYVFRGMKDDAYLTGTKDKQYMTNRFSSASIDGYGVAYQRFSGEHTLQRIKILKGSSCLCMLGTSKFHDEYEILLPRGSTYVIRGKSEDMRRLNPVYPNSALQGPDESLVNKLVDVTLYAAPATPIHKKGAVHIKVPVAPANAANIAKVQRLISARLGVTGKLGQGAAGAVYLGTTNNGANYAIKMQKVGRNSNTELAALRKLKNTGVVPRIRGSEVLNWNKNLKNLMPRLSNGNKVSVIYQNRIEGVPLGSFFTGTGVTALMKQRIANAMTTIHKKGVIHGNLHRDNVIIAKNGKPYLIDFGKAYMRPSGFKNSMNANRFLKKHAAGSMKKAGKMAYYLNKANTDKWHFSNQNFLNRLTTK